MMHPRNTYNKAPDFDELARNFTEFAKISQLDIAGKVKIDFKKPESVRVLTRCLLQKDFDLDVVLPPQKLLPTVPNRLNYLLWIEDLLQHSKLSDNIIGIDIGCGASCIYCLLSVRMNKDWKMFALEIDQENLKYAQDNISRNQLEGCVTVITQDDSATLFQKLLQNHPEQKSFCVCNPPFFSSDDEVKNRSGKRKIPRSHNSGTQSELIFEAGGELGFVDKILKESLQLRDRIQIYSSMFGCKKNLLKFIEKLKESEITNYTKTEFVQGKTMRWGIAWSFNLDLHSFKDHNEALKKNPSSKNILQYEFSQTDFGATVNVLRETFLDLQMAVKVIEESPDKLYRWELTATQNTWKNQRRKRRAEERSDSRIKSPALNSTTSNQDLHIGFEVQNKFDKSIQLRMFFISGTMSKDSTNQIMQLLRNKFH